MTSIASQARLAAVARVLPERILQRVLPPGLRWESTRAQVAVCERGSTPSMLIAPANSAGQGHLWARAVRERLDDVDAVNLMAVPMGGAAPSGETDFSVPLAATRFSRRWRREQRQAVRRDFTHVLVESGRSPYGADERGLAGTLTMLTNDGLAVATLWHGSDIRIPSVHAAAEPDSPFGSNGAYPANGVARLERAARANLDALAAAGEPVFVSTPGLLDVPGAQWLPVVVDLERWRAEREPLTGNIPIVAYAPSSALLKGDDSIDTQMSALEAEGVVRYRRVHGVPAERMPEVYRSADVVLDQFRIGDYGVAACEAMAAGRPVIGHVSDAVRQTVRMRTGLELPIIESRYRDVGATVRDVLRDLGHLRVLGEEGRRFVRHTHDGAASARALALFLDPRSQLLEQK